MTVTNKLDFSRYSNIINGKPASTAKTRHAINPATEGALPEVPISTQDDVDKAVAAARAAFPKWSKTSWEQREKLLNELADGLEANADGFRDILVKETGKPAATVAIEFQLTVAFMRGIGALRVKDETIIDDAEASATVRYVPLGVGAAIVPWNWPLVLAQNKLSTGLITGNCVILKPSPFAPYTIMKLAELAASIFPPGVVQVLSGDDGLGPMLTAHDGIDKVSFTGSSPTGKKVAASCAATLKRVTLELGGNDAAIVCDDVDLAKTVPGVGMMAFLSAGQICMNVKRIYVHERIYDQFKVALVDFLKHLKVGDPAEGDTTIGPIQNKMQYDKVQGMYASIQTEGWKAATGGAKDLRDQLPKGYFMQPTIIDNPPENSRIVQDEPFGPIVPLIKWSDEADVLKRANASKMGLGGSVWSGDVERAKRLASQLESGSAWVNCHFKLDPRVPYGGAKWSGIGRELGDEGLKGWLEPQSLWVSKA